MLEGWVNKPGRSYAGIPQQIHFSSTSDLSSFVWLFKLSSPAWEVLAGDAFLHISLFWRLFLMFFTSHPGDQCVFDVYFAILNVTASKNKCQDNVSSKSSIKKPVAETDDYFLLGLVTQQFSAFCWSAAKELWTQNAQDACRLSTLQLTCYWLAFQDFLLLWLGFILLLQASRLEGCITQCLTCAKLQKQQKKEH